MASQDEQHFTPSVYMMDAKNVAEMARLVRDETFCDVMILQSVWGEKPDE